MKRISWTSLMGLPLLWFFVWLIPAPSAQTPQKPSTYITGACFNDSFTLERVVLDKDQGTFTIDYYMPEPSVVEHVDNPYIFNIKIASQEGSPNTTRFDGDLVVKGHEKEVGDHKIEVHGLISSENKKFVAIVSLDDQVSHLLYGAEGKVDDMIKSAVEFHLQCATFHQLPFEALPSALRDWLDK